MVILVALASTALWILINPDSYNHDFIPENPEIDSVHESSDQNPENYPLATTVLNRLEIKGRAPKTGYNREAFYQNWPLIDGCSLRQRIIKRELNGSALESSDNNCDIIAGEYDEPYTGKHLVFTTKDQISKQIQIDHVVALSDAWQKGAQYKTPEIRYQIATDPLNLLAVDAKANQQKSDGDAATWLPKNKKFRCQYIARQIAVKFKYGLWVTQAEHDAMTNILTKCPNQPAPGVSL